MTKEFIEQYLEDAFQSDFKKELDNMTLYRYSGQDFIIVGQNDLDNIILNYPPLEYSVTIFPSLIRERKRADINFLIENGYITADDWCPVKQVPFVDRKTVSEFLITLFFHRKRKANS